MRTPFSSGCRHGCRQHIGLERRTLRRWRLRCWHGLHPPKEWSLHQTQGSSISRESYPIRIQNVAEGEGFEPLKACPLVVFKTTAIDHSAIPPASINDTLARI